MGSRDRNTGTRQPRPAKSAGKPKNRADLPDIAPDDGISAGDVQFAEGNDLGSGQRDLPEELQTDGPVMGGPGMMRTGADRAISTGTGGLAAGERARSNKTPKNRKEDRYGS